MSEINVTGKYLKDSEGNIFSPITASKTVFLEDETPLDESLDSKLDKNKIIEELWYNDTPIAKVWGNNNLIILIENSGSNYVIGDVLKFPVESDTDVFLTVLEVNSSGGVEEYAIHYRRSYKFNSEIVQTGVTPTNVSSSGSGLSITIKTNGDAYAVWNSYNNVMVTGGKIVNGGSGYAVNDLLYFTDPDNHIFNVVFKVTSIDSTGSVTAITNYTQGSTANDKSFYRISPYYYLMNNVYNMNTNGNGIGAQLQFLINAQNSSVALQDINTEIRGLTDRKSSANHLLNGSAAGSLRQLNSAMETGVYTIGQNAFAEGNGTKAKGAAAHAEGTLTIASGNSAHAEGNSSIASGTNSHAEGQGTASGNCAHAEGGSSQASGQYAHAEGSMTFATGDRSHTEGQFTKAGSANQHVQGKFNIEDASNIYAHIVGNGADNDNRSNAHTVDWSGNAWYQGNVYVRGTNQTTNSHVLIADDTLVEYKYRDKNGVLSQDKLLDYITEKYDNSCSGIAYVEYYGQPGNDVMYAVWYYQSGYLVYEPLGVYKYHSPTNNTPVWIDGTTRSSENGEINNATSDTTSQAFLRYLYTTNLSNITIQVSGGGRFPEYTDVTTTYTLSGTNATCVCSGTNFANYESIRAKITYSDSTTVYTDDYEVGGGVVCFTENTLVETENGFKAIKDIEVGDKVYSYNLETKQVELKEIDKIFSHTVKEIVNIYTEREIIEATGSHPFYTAYNQKKLAKNLKPNDLLRTKQNLFRPIKQVIIDEVEDKEVYEIRVKDNNNYFVGSEGILVYNEPNIIED